MLESPGVRRVLAPDLSQLISLITEESCSRADPGDWDAIVGSPSYFLLNLDFSSSARKRAFARSYSRVENIMGYFLSRTARNLRRDAAVCIDISETSSENSFQNPSHLLSADGGHQPTLKMSPDRRGFLISYFQGRFLQPYFQLNVFHHGNFLYYLFMFFLFLFFIREAQLSVNGEARNLESANERHLSPPHAPPPNLFIPLCCPYLCQY